MWVTTSFRSGSDKKFFDRNFREGAAVKLHYYPETDSLYIELKGASGAETREVVEGLVVDLDADRNVVGLDIDKTPEKLDLWKIETIALPPLHAIE
jgi:uncharacterized protein YuzE